MYGQVVRPDPELEQQLRRFVRVRITRISALDHGLFRFDKNLSFAVLFLNSDLDVYGRYGTRAGGGFKGPFRPYADTIFLANKDMSAKGLRKAVDRVQGIHEAWLKNAETVRRRLAGKTPTSYLGQPVVRPEVIRQPRRAECFHCHRVAEEEVAFYFNRRKAVPDALLWSFPMPDPLGFTCDPDECATVRKIVADSEAARAGLRVGDAIRSIDGVPMVSIADVQWALDRAPDRGVLKLRVKRSGRAHDLTLALPAGWRRRSEFAWRYAFNGLKAKLLGFDELTDLGAAEREREVVRDDESAVRIGRVLRSRRRAGYNGAARAAGLRAKDIILDLDGQGRQTQSEMLAYVLQTKHPGDEVTLTVLRRGERKKFTFELQRILKKRGHDH